MVSSDSDDAPLVMPKRKRVESDSDDEKPLVSARKGLKVKVEEEQGGSSSDDVPLSSAGGGKGVKRESRTPASGSARKRSRSKAVKIDDDSSGDEVCFDHGIEFSFAVK